MKVFWLKMLLPKYDITCNWTHITCTITISTETISTETTSTSTGPPSTGSTSTGSTSTSTGSPVTLHQEQQEEQPHGQQKVNRLNKYL